ncbi:MAG: hypothetical protein KA712_16135 [Myxococcales bacterium]|nr:hypothetical protein [Myxococcales bacterium]
MSHHIPSWSYEQRLSESIRQALPKVGPKAAEQLRGLLTPEAIAIVAGVLVAWIVSHAFGIGEIIDIILLVVGVLSVGWAIFSGIEHLYEFASLSYRAVSQHDLVKAGDHLARAVSILGVQAVLAVLFRGARAPKVNRGSLRGASTGPRSQGIRYKPTITKDPSLPAGNGWTTKWGDIVVSTRGTGTEKALVLPHEKVHQFLTPKLLLFRNYRVNDTSSTYLQSSLWRYIEEALAETIAQVGAIGFRNFFTGLRFPVANGYVYLKAGGGFDAAFKGHGVLRELGSLVHTGVISEIAYELRFENGTPSVCPSP